ncbi:hypothetical protein [Pseudomonas sp. PCH199]|uniref:hypothetical protein n=1 Tax=Pseudomonas sp. PCH199 TaxID=2778915 RepID=UPI002244BEED|nr:hypothetical protein [Pseudomonas sp. PCH199]
MDWSAHGRLARLPRHAGRTLPSRRVVREVGGNKPYIGFVHLDLAANPHAPMLRVRFRGSCGRLALIDELQALRKAGVQHVGLHVRRSERPVSEIIEEIAEHVLPKFH